MKQFFTTCFVLGLTTAAFTQANTHLSNLVSPTAVNQHLLPNSTNARDLGSSTLAWRNLYLRGYVYLDGTRFVSNAPGTGNYNAFVGSYSGNAITTGKFNTAVGHNSLYKLTTGFSNTATGAFALYNNTASANTAVGDSALYANTSGYFNTALGYLSLSKSTTGYYNNASGYTALFSNTTGSYNTASGSFALYSNSTGVLNEADGYAALYINTTGNYNTGIGPYALYSNSTGSSNTALGYFANVAQNNLTNATAIGANSVANASNQIMLGSNAVNSVRMQTGSAIAKYLEFVKTGAPIDWRYEHSSSGRYLYLSSSVNDFAGFSDRAYFDTAVVTGYVLHVLGKSVGNAWVTSDAKLKNNIDDVTDALTLINKLKPKTYFYNRQKYAYLNLPPERQYGLIAQELEQVLPELVTTSKEPVGVDEKGNRQTEELKAVNYTELIAVLVKAVQEQQQQITELKQEVSRLSERDTRAALTGTYLEQNTPNPASSTTTIRYHIAPTATSALLNLTNAKGQLVKTLSLSKESAQVSLNAAMLASGTYNYTLYVDGKQVDSKRLLIAR